LTNLAICSLCELDSECAGGNVCGRADATANAGFCTPERMTSTCCAIATGVQICYYADGTRNLPPYKCTQPAVVTNPSITDFTGVALGATFTGPGGLTTIVGAVSDTPATAIESGAVHVAGTVGGTFPAITYVAFNCADASAYSGISFTITGNVGPSSTLQVSINTDEDDDRTIGGRCATSCVGPVKSVAVEPSSTPISIAWADTSGGKPLATPNPKLITGVVISTKPNMSGQSYLVDYTIDNLRFW